MHCVLYASVSFDKSSTHVHPISTNNSALTAATHRLSFVIKASCFWSLTSTNLSTLKVVFAVALLSRMSYKLAHRIFICVEFTEFYESVTALVFSQGGNFQPLFLQIFVCSSLGFSCHRCAVRSLYAACFLQPLPFNVQITHF